MTNKQAPVQPATFDCWVSNSCSNSVFYYTARNAKFYVQAMFIYLPISDIASATIRITKLSAAGFVSDGVEIFNSNELSKQQINQILAFNDPQAFIDYTLSLMPTPSPIDTTLTPFNHL